ncbi:leucine--tRNA ligase [Patescibacteria group bacterium]|nr:leucine--tRNA ligase [Patescibacteria group bacterium]MCL5409305.1 leucine--tRNA ligase [Patescibacteria group bacterium]
MKKYIPNHIENKWQQRWGKDNLYFTDLQKTGQKFYCLVELAYSSGDLHMGHWFTFTMGDILARFKRMQGFNVLLPNGFDAFGLPAENAAIKRGIHPQDWTMSNITRMKQQFTTMGASFDWEKSTISCLPEYYRWNQWIFLKMYEKGLAYRGKTYSSWCPSCQTVVAEENVEAGKCWRCETEVIQKEVEQWFLKITAYADDLLWSEPPEVAWPKSLRESQNAWIGKSKGALIKFPLAAQKNQFIEIFTTRPDTIYGATFLIINPEHPLLKQLLASKHHQEVAEYVIQASKKSEQERKENKEKSGVFTGSFVTNPLTHQQIPIWVADYVLPGYGTGAIMAVPAHDQRDFDFAKKFGLEIVPVIDSGQAEQLAGLPFTGEGKLINSQQFDDLTSKKAAQEITDHLHSLGLGEHQTTYHLHDWSISRQRYWGTPIPFVYCDKCGLVPVPEKDLPVELPYKVDYTPQGKPPLATAEQWVNVDCPQCGGSAKRETETMDGFMDNSWYFFRYLDPHNEHKIFDQELISKWMPLEIYIGGAEHTLGHALYSRFFTKFFHDLGLVKFTEYAEKRLHHGLILGVDGTKMSKSKGNVVNPDEQVKLYGADAIRTYLAFLGPFDIVAPWDPNGVGGVFHFLERVWNLQDKVSKNEKLSKEDYYQMHKTIKKVTDDIETMKNNTAVAALMEWLNFLSKKTAVSLVEYEKFLLLLSPFAPHLTEEVWQQLGQAYSIHQQDWPQAEEKYLQAAEVKIAVMIDGKLRAQLVIDYDIVNKETDVVSQALKLEKISKLLLNKDLKRKIYVSGKVVNFVTQLT